MLFLKQAANIHAICQGRAKDGGGKAGDGPRQHNVLGGVHVHIYAHTHTNFEVLAQFNNKEGLKTFILETPCHYMRGILPRIVNG